MTIFAPVMYLEASLPSNTTRPLSYDCSRQHQDPAKLRVAVLTSDGSAIRPYQTLWSALSRMYRWCTHHRDPVQPLITEDGVVVKNDLCEVGEDVTGPGPHVKAVRGETEVRLTRCS